MATISQYPNLLASGVDLVSAYQPFQLFAGESDIVTDQATAAAAAIEQFRVVARDANGHLIPWDGTTLSGQGAPMGIAAQPIPATTRGPIFTGGAFNHAALVWPAGVTTLDARKAAFDGTNIQIGEILGSPASVTFS